MTKDTPSGTRTGFQAANDSQWGASLVAPQHPRYGSMDEAIPWDLSQWVTVSQLLQWVDEEIACLAWDNPELVEFLRVNPNYHPRMMLGAITFAYAIGVFESEEIVRRCGTDPLFRGLCKEATPKSAPAIRKFRRDNRGLLKWALNQILKRAVSHETGSDSVSAGLKRLLTENASARIELARHLDRAL